MSRIAKSPVEVPKGVDLSVEGQDIKVKGAKGERSMTVHPDVVVSFEDGVVSVKPRDEASNDFAMAGTMRSLIANMVQGVSQGFEKKLQLVGVGYRTPWCSRYRKESRSRRHLRPRSSSRARTSSR